LQTTLLKLLHEVYASLGESFQTIILNEFGEVSHTANIILDYESHMELGYCSEATGYELDDCLNCGMGDSSLCHHIQTSSATWPAFYAKGNSEEQ
jgi:hypothetical protein